jgi:hypothetical protein
MYAPRRVSTPRSTYEKETPSQNLLRQLRDAVESTVANVPYSEKQDHCFLPKGDLDRIIDSRSLAQLFRELLTDNEPVNSPEDVHNKPQPWDRDGLNVDESVEHCINMTINTPSRRALLALFLYQERPELLALFMQWVKSNSHYAPSDESMPFTSTTLLEYGVPKGLHNGIVLDQAIFTPITIRKGRYHILRTKDRLPFIGGQPDIIDSFWDTVCKVTVAPHHFEVESGNGFMLDHPNQTMVLALKCFKDVPAMQDMEEATFNFECELGILRELRESSIKHQAILLDWGSLTIINDAGIPTSYYLMFELPTFSLATFLYSEPCARAGTSMSLLLAKFVDIVGALAFLHDNLGTLHLDIRPDNILVFEQDASRSDPQDHDEHRLIWKLSNFELARKVGARGRTIHNASRLSPHWSTVAATRPPGTYQGPELQQRGLSRARWGSDVWSIGCVALQILAFVSGGPGEVSNLDARLLVDFLDSGGQQRLF